MRRVGIVLGILLFGVTAQPQNISSTATPLAWHRSLASPLLSVALRDAMVRSARPAPAPAPQAIAGVYPLENWQASFGFTYLRFYEAPGSVLSTNGFNSSVDYFFKPWMAAEGEVDAGMGSQLGQSSQTVFTGGGLRLRTVAPRPLSLWIHALAGEMRFSPKTSFGGQNALAYEGGVGVDIRTHHNRLSYRVGVDMLGSSFFGTYQVSPKVSAGIVCKF